MYASLVVILTIISGTACNGNSDTEKSGMDSIAATPNPVSTDTLRMNKDTMRVDSMPTNRNKKKH